MAGAGVSIGGAGMLRARRRDVSVKPNRKLDRKSSRGMIYENEELRLRTININAEVEQGHNDIKKLRRENEQLRHEIWSLRDEYDKLEEILKAQKNREASEDYEDRSETEDINEDDEAEEFSDYSEEETEEDHDTKENDQSGQYERTSGSEANHEERLENAENQKISSEKMNTSGHRLHVEFDDLSVVEEEDELKKERELKDTACSSNDREMAKVVKETEGLRAKTQCQYFSPHYGTPGVSIGPNNHCPDRTHAYPSSDVTDFRGTLPIESPAMLLAQCPDLFDQDAHQDYYGKQVGWRNNIFASNVPFPTPESCENEAMVIHGPGECPASIFCSGQADDPAARSLRAKNSKRGFSMDDKLDSSCLGEKSNFPSLLQRRRLLTRQLTNIYGDSAVSGVPGSSEAANSAGMTSPNGWDFGDPRDRLDPREIVTESEIHRIPEDTILSDRPRHFFAPLTSNVQHSRENSADKTFHLVDPPDLFETFGTGKSSSSDRTTSTVISARHFQPRSRAPMSLTSYPVSNGIKGPADICVNGAIASHPIDQAQEHSINGEKIYKSSNDLLIADALVGRGNPSSWQGSNNHMVKSVSCQDLSHEQLETSFLEMTRSFQGDAKCQKFAKSDNTLDNTSARVSKAFKSQLNVTLRLPSGKIHRYGDNVIKSQSNTPEIPEIPKLPSIDYRIFNNPFLRSFDGRVGFYGNCETSRRVARPLVSHETSRERDKSLQQQTIDYPSAALTQSFTRRLNPEDNTMKGVSRTCVASNVEPASERSRGISFDACQALATVDPRLQGNSPKLRPDYQATSFEAPDPRSLHPRLAAYDIDPLDVLSSMGSQMSNHPKLYRNLPFVPGPTSTVYDSQRALRVAYENNALAKVPAQTQTSGQEDGNGDETANPAIPAESVRKNSKTSETENYSGATDSPVSTMRRRRTMRKERQTGKIGQRPLSPAAQRRRLRKQTSIDIVDEPIERVKSTVNKIRRTSPTTTTTTSDHMEEKIESRSSSSGLDSPRKEHNRRVSAYFNGKKTTSGKKTRSFSVDDTRDGVQGGARNAGETLDTTNSERERTNSASSREVSSSKGKRSSISSGKVPWCACWGNGCV